VQEAIRRRAREIYERSGRIAGRDVQNWIQAEAEVLHQPKLSPGHAAIVIRVNGVQYIGEYHPSNSAGYTPGEFGSGGSVPVRFQHNKMYVKRPNGKELETTIVKRPPLASAILRESVVGYRNSPVPSVWVAQGFSAAIRAQFDAASAAGVQVESLRKPWTFRACPELVEGAT
jgi:hypothetical protein